MVQQIAGSSFGKFGRTVVLRLSGFFRARLTAVRGIIDRQRFWLNENSAGLNVFSHAESFGRTGQS
jgi:hypothetical protein